MSADRDRLAATLEEHAWRGIVDVRFALDALLPVVDRIANERAATELRAAADWLNGDPDKGGAPYIAGDGSVLFPYKLEIAEVVTWAAASIRDRAAELDPT